MPLLSTIYPSAQTLKILGIPQIVSVQENVKDEICGYDQILNPNKLVFNEYNVKMSRQRYPFDYIR